MKDLNGGLGNILPNNKALDRADRFADREFHGAVAKADAELACCERRELRARNGELVEVRYYRAPAQYTSVALGVVRPGAHMWFETRADGYDYAITA